MVRLCGAALGFFAFAVTVLLGLMAGNSAEVTILRALWAMVAFCALGLVVGWIAYRVIDDHATRMNTELFANGDDAPVVSDEASKQQAEGSADTPRSDKAVATAAPVR
jgi:hypothetical protein